MSEKELTWDQYLDDSALKLSLSRSRDAFDRELLAILEFIKDKNTPSDFWQLLLDRYETAPKPIEKEASAAAALNALVLSAQAVLAAHAKGKR